MINKKILTAGIFLLVFSSQAIWINFSAVTTFVAKDIGASVKQVGFLAITYPFFFLILTFPSGILLDRNFKKWIIFGSAMTFLGAAGKLIYFNWLWFFFCQVFAAIGQPFLLNSFVVFASKIYPEKRTEVISLFTLSMYTGAIFALFSGVKLYEMGGIKTLILPQALLAFLGFIFLLAGKNLLSKNFPSSPEKFSLSNLGYIFKRYDLWLIGSILGFGVATFDNLLTWLQPVLKNEALEKIAGISSASTIFFGLIGIAIIPKIISAKNLRTLYLRCVIPIIIIFFLILRIKVSKFILLFALSLSGFLMLPSYVLIMDWVGKFYKKEVGATAIGFIGLISRIISVILTVSASYFIGSSKIYFTFLLFPILITFLITLFLPDDRNFHPAN